MKFLLAAPVMRASTAAQAQTPAKPIVPSRDHAKTHPNYHPIAVTSLDALALAGSR